MRSDAVRDAVGELKAQELGRRQWLDKGQFAGLRSTLLAGAQTASLPTELQTIKRVRRLIKQRFDVEYLTVGCWRLLHHLGFSPQEPKRQATQRDEEAIVAWKRKTWPARGALRPRRLPRHRLYRKSAG